jgi:predicted ATPase
MRIVVSGTHGSGKSTLISDFVERHPEYTVLPDPYELLDESWDSPGAGMFAAQLRLTADRLIEGEGGDHVIAERGPIDFLAYLLAVDELSREQVSDALLARASALTATAMDEVDVLAVLPLTPALPAVPDDEDPRLRAVMNDVLLDLLDDPSVTGEAAVAADITGDRATRVAELEGLVRRASGAGGPFVP